MSIIKTALFLFYNYYRKGRWEKVPVFHASASLSLLTWMNIVTVLCFTGMCELIFTSRAIVILTIAILLGAVYLIAINSKLQYVQVSEPEIKLRWKILVIYIIISFAVMTASFFYATSAEPTLIKPIK